MTRDVFYFSRAAADHPIITIRFGWLTQQPFLVDVHLTSAALLLTHLTISYPIKRVHFSGGKSMWK